MQPSTAFVVTAVSRVVHRREVAMRRRIGRILTIAVCGAALLAGLPGGASAHHAAWTSDLVTTVVDDVDDTWAGVFRRAGELYVSPDVVLYEGTISTPCGTLSGGDIASTCTADGTIYLDEVALTDIAAEHGTVAVALVVADAWGYHVLDQFGIAGSGFARDQQATCLAGVWAWYAEEAGSITTGAIDVGADFYEATYTNGDLLADAFVLGYATDDIRTCFSTGLGTY